MRPPLNKQIQMIEAAERAIRTGSLPRPAERPMIVTGLQDALATLRELWAAEQEQAKGVKG